MSIDTTSIKELQEQATWNVNAALEAGHEDWAIELSKSYDRRLAALEASLAKQNRAA